MLAAVLVALGGLVAVWALWQARGRGGRGRRPDLRGQVTVPNANDPKAAAWAILNQPLQTQASAWEELTALPALRQFRLGAAFGLGVGLTLAGVLVAVVPARAPAPAPPRSVQRPEVPAPSPGLATPAPAPAGPAPAPAPAAPGPKGGAISVVVAEGDLPAAVAAKLRSAGAIPSERAFLDRLVERQLDTRLRAGTFTIPAGASLDAVIDALTS